jgi:type I restriction enzyme M protein
VPKKEIKDNGYDLSINRYKEIVYEEVEYEKPEELIASIKELDAERQEALSNLENMIG